MAAAPSSSFNSSDSDSNSEGDVNASSNIIGYQFEPERSSGSDSDQLPEGQQNTDSEAELDAPQEREGNTDWCQCTQCDISTLSRRKEHKCCREYTKIAHDVLEQGLECVTQKGSFEILCLHPDVLTNVLICLNSIRNDHWGIRPPSNKSLRFAAYRQYTWWIHGHLGRRVRRVIPACVVYRIRKAFPKTDGEEYEPYASDSEDNE